MYVPEAFRESDPTKLFNFIEANSFGLLVSQVDGKPFASHLPFLLDRPASPHGRLLGHLAAANPQGQQADGQTVLVIFSGPHAYISPTWYNHVNVPTWNYQSVHLYGKPRIITDYEEAYRLLKRLVDRYESNSPYQLESLPKDFVEKEIKGIVAFQIDVTKLEANYKLSQNRKDADYANIILQLERRTDDLSHGVADAMRQNRRELAR